MRVKTMLRTIIAVLTSGRLLTTICLVAMPMALAFTAETKRTSETSHPTADQIPAGPESKAQGVDLSYVPSTALALVAIRPAEMLKTADLPQLKALIQQRCGPTFSQLRLPVEKIAQITWVPASRAAVAEKGNLVIYQMTGPYDFQELIRAELPQASKQQYEVQAGYIPKAELNWSGSFGRIIDDYLGLLKNTKITTDGNVLRADTTADLAALRDALSLLVAKYVKAP
jgi:hypothetical protein